MLWWLLLSFYWQGWCYHIEPIAREENQHIAYVAYTLDVLKEGYVSNIFTFIVGDVFGFAMLYLLFTILMILNFFTIYLFLLN